jgi:hypothetical protein
MIPAKEKARELVDKFEPYVIRYTQGDVVGYLDQETPILEYQKQCALIAVDEILEASLYQFDEMDKYVIYWQEVKQKIELL